MSGVYWVIILLMIFIGLTFFRFEHGARKFKIIVLVVVALLIYLSLVSVFSSDKVDLSSPAGVVNSAYFYFGWVGHTVANLWNIGVDTVHTVGNAIKVSSSK